MNKIETDLSECKKCKITKSRILIGKFDEKNKKYVDDTDKLWNGRLCPECNVSRAKDVMRGLRAKKSHNIL